MARKPDIFDEIILYLKESASSGQGDFTIAPEILEELYAPRTGKTAAAPPPAPAFIPPPAAPAPAAAPRAAVPDCSAMNWDELRESVSHCTGCALCSARKHVVFGEGPENARLMFIGEGPGADEDEQGRPFVGRAGELLTKMIAAMGFSRANEVYIGNIVKCRPPQNRTPLPEEAQACLGYIKRQIALIRPQVIVTLGATPLLYLFNLKGITRLRGKFLDYEGIKVMPTYHPAYLLRDPSKKIDVWRDLQLVMREFGKTPPAPAGRK